MGKFTAAVPRQLVAEIMHCDESHHKHGGYANKHHSGNVFGSKTFQQHIQYSPFHVTVIVSTSNIVPRNGQNEKRNMGRFARISEKVG